MRNHQQCQFTISTQSILLNYLKKEVLLHKHSDLVPHHSLIKLTSYIILLMFGIALKKQCQDCHSDYVCEITHLVLVK